MQVQINTDVAQQKPTKEFNLGDTVTWKSHANGKTTRKIGKIIAVLSPGEWEGIRNLPKKVFVDILREYMGYTRDHARDELNKGHYYTWYVGVLELKYKLKFNAPEGMYRDEYHYLIEVDRGDGRKPYLYHPKTSCLRLAD